MNVLPFQVPSSEDEASFKRNTASLIKEFKKKKNRNMALVDQLMDLTFAQRRNHIVGSELSLVQATNQYMFLELSQEVRVAYM